MIDGEDELTWTECFKTQNAARGNAATTRTNNQSGLYDMSPKQINPNFVTTL